MKNEYSFKHFKITHKYKIQLLFPELEKNMGKYIFPGYLD